MISSMCKKIIFLAILLLISSSARAQNNDPCSNAQLVQSVAINTSTAASIRLVNSTDAEKKTYICHLIFTMVGAATPQTIAVQYGIGATCGTGTTLRTGTFKASTVVGSITTISIPANTIQPIPVGFSTCILTTTTDTVNGIMSYALQ